MYFALKMRSFFQKVPMRFLQFGLIFNYGYLKIIHAIENRPLITERKQKKGENKYLFKYNFEVKDQNVYP